MIKFSNKIEETVGIDIGSFSIKAVSLAKESGNNVLTAYNLKQMSSGKKSAEVKGLISEVLKEIDLFPEEINLSMSGPDVIVRFIDFPKMTKEQLENALEFEAEKYIPFNVNEVVMDFIVLGDASEPGQMRVLLAAIKREPVKKIVEYCESLGITVNVLDIDPLAMFNAFTENNPSLEDKKGVAFLDLGHSQTNILVSIGKLPCFMRQIQIGGKDVMVAGDKRKPDVIESGQESEKGSEQSANENDSETVIKPNLPVLDDMIREMQLSLGYFENRYNTNISDIYCCGGLVYQQGVIDYLSDKLGTQVKMWNPVENITISENISKEDINSVASQLAVSVGLALRG